LNCKKRRTSKLPGSAIAGTTALNFNITKYDPDGTIPDAYWYVDNTLVEYDAGSSVDSFTYTFGCGVSGLHNVSVRITDGLVNDSIQWNFSISEVMCAAPSGAGGGAGAGAAGCIEKWVCEEWSTCQNTEESLKKGNLSRDDYRFIKDFCEKNKSDEFSCGFQIRNCYDLNSCHRTTNKPEQVEFCYFTEMPSCNDKIKNCHDNLCELLVDCGGPCAPCPTCSDGIKNQGEERADCGGPCPACPAEVPLVKKPEFRYAIVLILVILLIILAIIIAIKIYRIMQLKKTAR